MSKKALLVSVMLALGLISGCAQQNLNAPCPNFGMRCGQQPINSWDFNR
jgi:hypothetical protein